MSSVMIGGQLPGPMISPLYSRSAAFLGFSRSWRSRWLRHLTPVDVVVPCLFHCCMMLLRLAPLRTFSYASAMSGASVGWSSADPVSVLL